MSGALPVTAVIFDLDGTLVQHGHVLLPPLLVRWGHQRTLDQVDAAFNRQIHWFYNRVLDAEEQGWMDELWRSFYGHVLEDLGIPDPGGELAVAMLDYFSRHPTPPLFEDVHPILDALAKRGCRLGVITQRPRYGAAKFLADLGILERFEVLIAGDDGHGRKPTPAPFLAALAQLNVPPEEAVYVGDRIDDDCMGAAGAGLRAFLIDRPGQHREAVRPCAYIDLCRLDQLLDYLPEPPAELSGEPQK